MKLLALQGLPASGKTTEARKLVDSGWIRVNKDDLRSMLHNSKWSSKNEAQVISIRDAIIIDSLKRNKNVVVDDTNFNKVHIESFKQLAMEYDATFEKKFIDTPIEECIARDLARPNSVGEKVIRKMYSDYLAPQPTVYIPPEGKPDAYIFDIDGTLAHGIGITRKPYEWHKVGTDTLDQELRHILMSLRGYDVMDDPEETVKIILMSGRDSVCRPETEQWLKDNNIPYDHLYMRSEGDKRKDFEVKEELFNQHIRDNYRVRVIFDDRSQVVELWRSLGLICYQVAYGNF